MLFNIQPDTANTTVMHVEINKVKLMYRMVVKKRKDVTMIYTK